MFCKYCGKEIDKDSMYCSYCGRKQVTDNVYFHNNNVERKKAKSFSSKNSGNAIANEIVKNFKMVCISLALFLAYMIGFVIYHQKDIKESVYPQISTLGASCYDPVMLPFQNVKLSWVQHYYDKLYFDCFGTFPTVVEHDISKCKKDAENLEKLLNYSELDFENLKKEAKKLEKESIDWWNDYLGSNRKAEFKKDLKNNALYSGIICVLITILGRYFVLLIRWVNKNRT